MNIFDYLEKKYKFKEMNSCNFIYDDMESQSNEFLPVIYKEFDMKNKFHWADRGALWDFIYSINADKNSKILDFGPGDGWPSLLMAPYVNRVIGLDASQKRIDVCTSNAKRLNIDNVSYILSDKDKLPFQDETFDGIVAASSVEETSDPYKILEEFYRILKPGGMVRMYYESVTDKNQLWIGSFSDKQSSLILKTGDLEREVESKYRIVLNMEEKDLRKFLQGISDDIFKALYENIDKLENKIEYVSRIDLFHPVCSSYIKKLKEIGFKMIKPTYSGAKFSAQLFEELELNRFKTIENLDNYLRPIVKNVVKLRAPVEKNHMLTFQKGE